MCVEHALDVEEWAFSAFNDRTCKESLVLVKRRGPGLGHSDNIKTKSLSLFSSSKKTTFTFLKQDGFHHCLLHSFEIFKTRILQREIDWADVGKNTLAKMTMAPAMAVADN